MQSDEEPELTKEMLSRSRVIAKGKRIRDLEWLLDEYGGQPSKWTKKSSPQFYIGDKVYEYHWYEHHGIGRVALKRKQVG